MGSTFAGLSLFDSGPHRFVVGRLGRLTRGPFRTPLDLPVTTDEGVREVLVIQTGRLVAATNAALWQLVDAIQTQSELPLTGTLVDHHGRVWLNMTLFRFQPGEQIDRGRKVSLEYEARYLQFG